MALTRPPQTLTQNLTPTLIPTCRLRSRAFASLTEHKALHAKGRGAKAGIPDLVIDAVVKVRAARWCMRH